jgi:hypothetical protein
LIPKNEGWQVHSFGVRPGYEGLEAEVEKKMGGKPLNAETLFPERRIGAGFAPVTTGQGREYLLLYMGEKAAAAGEPTNDIWTFQIASEKSSAAAFKDRVRSLVGRGTGSEQWAKAELMKSDDNKEEGDDEEDEKKKKEKDGAVDFFPRGLKRFGSSAASEWTGNIVIWGGIEPGLGGGGGGEVNADGWTLVVE